MIFFLNCTFQYSHLVTTYDLSKNQRQTRKTFTLSHLFFIFYKPLMGGLYNLDLEIHRELMIHDY